MPRRAGRGEGARDREQSDALALEIFAAGRRLGPVGVGDRSGTSGRRSPTWIVIAEFSFASGEAADRRGGWRASSLARHVAAGAPHCRAVMDCDRADLPVRQAAAGDAGNGRPALRARGDRDVRPRREWRDRHRRRPQARRDQLPRRCSPARDRAGPGAGLRRPSRRSGRARARLRAPFERLGRAGHAARRGAGRASCSR